MINEIRTYIDKVKNFKKVDAQEEVDAWHGSPHEFDAFDLSKIGAGEGNQSFGWGLYFTDLESIARNYANLGQNVVTLNGKRIFELSEIEGLLASGDDSWAYVSSKLSLKYRLKELIQVRMYVLSDWDNQKKYYSKDGDKEEIEEEIEQAKWLISQIPNMVEEKNRNLYKVTLHKDKTPDQYNWLEWDKIPTKKQIVTILNGLEKDDFNKKRTQEYVYDYKKIKEADNGYSGRDVYQALSAILGGDKQASLFLLDLGIDGIKYPAESIARGATSDNARGFNYVVFDVNAITISNKEKF